MAIVDVITGFLDKFNPTADDAEKEKRKKEVEKFLEKLKEVKKKKAENDPHKAVLDEAVKIMEGWGIPQEKLRYIAKDATDISQVIQKIMEQLDMEDKELLEMKTKKEEEEAQEAAEQQFKHHLKRQSELAERYKELHAGVNTHKESHTDKKIELKNTERDLDSLEFDIDNEKKSIQSLENNLPKQSKSIESKNDGLRITIVEQTALKTSLETEISKISIRITEAESQINDPASSLSEDQKKPIIKEIDDDKKEVARLKGILPAVISSIDITTQKIASNTASLEDTKRNIEERKQKLSDLEEQHRTLSSKAETLRGEVKDSGATLESMKKDLATALAEKEVHDDKVGNGIGRKENKLVALDAEQKDIELAIKGNVDDLVKVSGDIEKYEKDLLLNEKKYKALKESEPDNFYLDEMKDRVERLRDKVGKLKDEKMKLQEDGVKLGKDLDAKKDEIKSEKEELEKLKEKNPTIEINAKDKEDIKKKKDPTLEIPAPAPAPAAKPKDGSNTQTTTSKKAEDPDKHKRLSTEPPIIRETDSFKDWLKSLMEAFINKGLGKLGISMRGVVSGASKIVAGGIGAVGGTLVGVPALSAVALVSSSIGKIAKFASNGKYGGPGSKFDAPFEALKKYPDAMIACGSLAKDGVVVDMANTWENMKTAYGGVLFNVKDENGKQKLERVDKRRGADNKTDAPSPPVADANANTTAPEAASSSSTTLLTSRFVAATEKLSKQKEDGANVKPSKKEIEMTELGSTKPLFESDKQAANAAILAENAKRAKEEREAKASKAPSSGPDDTSDNGASAKLKK